MWDAYTKHIIEKICAIKNKTNSPIIFMLWGSDAKQIKNVICNFPNVIIFEWTHPSPRNGNTFVSCDNFVKCNNALAEKKMKPIDWNIDEIHYKFQLHNKKVIVFTDGSCSKNGKNGAIGAYASYFVKGPLADYTIYGKLDSKQHNPTNQRAEGQAILSSLQFINTKISNGVEIDDIIIVTDSDFWIQMCQKYMDAWASSGKSFDEKCNPDITKSIYSLIVDLRAKQKTLEFRHVQSHDKSGWSKSKDGTYEKFCYDMNAYVDALAKFAKDSSDINKEIIKEPGSA
jgi:ribonuclease HI